MFFADAMLDDELPMVNQAFWSSLIGHVLGDHIDIPGVILDIGCHTGGLLSELNARFGTADLIGIEPLRDARLAAEKRLAALSTKVTLLDVSDWDKVSSRSVDLVTCHEVLYLEPVLKEFMSRVHRVLTPNGAAYIVLGGHSENPLWRTWKLVLTEAGHQVYDHAPLEIMEAASSAGFLASVQPLRRSGWVTYDPRGADFPYPDVRTMLDHHYRQKLIFRLRVADDQTSTS